MRERRFWLRFAGVPVLWFASAPGVTEGTGGGAPPAAPASPASAPAGGAPAAPPATEGAGAGSAAPAAGGKDENLATLRRNYEETRQRVQSYERHGTPEEIERRTGTYTKMVDRAVQLAKKAGFADERAQLEALIDDKGADAVFAFLAGRAAQRARDAAARRGPMTEEEHARLLDDKISEAMKPFRDAENRRGADAASALFQQQVKSLTDAAYPGVDLPPDERHAITDVVTEMAMLDPNVLTSLRSGKTAEMQRVFQQAQAWLDRYYVARFSRETAKGAGAGKPGKPGAEPPAEKKKWTLEEMIDDPSRIDEAAGRSEKDARYRS